MIDEAVADMACRMHLTPAQLNEAMVHAGFDVAALRERVRAWIAERWDRTHSLCTPCTSNRM